jgi:general secretion pathway protein K
VKKEKYREVWRRFLLSGRFAINDENEADALLDALGDWVDKDDDERLHGAEESYYQSLTPHYSCRNDKMATPDELLLVKGMTSEIVYGDKEHEGIIHYITVVGDDGKINLNTAALPVLQALSADMTEKLAQELIDFRDDLQHYEALTTHTWYREVSGFPLTLDLGSDLFVVISKNFEIRVDAAIHQYSRTGTGALLRAENQEQTLLFWKIE